MFELYVSLDKLGGKWGFIGTYPNEDIAKKWAPKRNAYKIVPIENKS